MRQEFQKTLRETALTTQLEEIEPVEGKSMEAHSSSPQSDLFSLPASGRLYEDLYGRRGGVDHG